MPPGYESPIREHNLLHLKQFTKVKEFVDFVSTARRNLNKKVCQATCDKNWPHCRLFTFPFSSTMQASMCPASLSVLLRNRTLDQDKRVSQFQ